jgi:hypothetical protein
MLLANWDGATKDSGGGVLRDGGRLVRTLQTAGAHERLAGVILRRQND